MSTVATKALDAVVAALSAAYPTVKVKRRRNTRETPLKGPGDSLPLLSVSIGEAEACERIGAGQLLVKYPLWVAWITSTAVAPNTADDTPAVRDKRQEIRQLFSPCPPLAGLPELNDVFPGARAPFVAPPDDPHANVSVIALTLECREAG